MRRLGNILITFTIFRPFRKVFKNYSPFERISG